MNKLIVSTALALSLSAATPVLAQTYYPSASATCVSIPAGLSLGSRSSDVTNLQTFLVAQNYPGSGSWMITGYFGAATAAAVRNFQQLHGLSQSGSVDAATASSISRGCGGVLPTYPIQPVYPIQPTYPTYPNPIPTYPTYPTYPLYGTAPTITSLSQNTGSPGNTVTIYGIGFDPYNNTINFGGTSVPGIASANGTSVTFTIPSYAYSYTYSLAGTPIQLSVLTSRGTSNAITFTVWSSGSGCNTYGYVYGSNNCGCTSAYNPYTYPYNNANNCYQYPPQTVNPVISYLSPQSGSVATTVTVYGTGFSTSGNSVHFGNGVITNLNSPDGRSVSFTVPSYISGYGTQPVTLSTYQVSLVNNLGAVSNTLPFSVTSLGSLGQPVITNVISPTSLAVGQQGTWTLSVGTANNQYLSLSVNWGDQNIYGAQAAQQQIYSGQQTTTLTHTYYTSGTYNITFTVSNSQGQQNSYNTTVYVSGSSVNGTSNVSIYNLAFNPQSITVQRGTTLTWTNNDSVMHTVTSDNNLFNSGGLNVGQSFSYTFNTPGTYTYHCAIHPSTGTVIVQ